jgi:hypothetical protein
MPVPLFIFPACLWEQTPFPPCAIRVSEPGSTPLTDPPREPYDCFIFCVHKPYADRDSMEK